MLTSDQKEVLQNISDIRFIGLTLTEDGNDEKICFWVAKAHDIKEKLLDKFGYSITRTPASILYYVKLKIRNGDGKEAMSILTNKNTLGCIIS